MSHTYCGSVLLYICTILYSSLYNWVKSTTIILLTLFLQVKYTCVGWYLLVGRYIWEEGILIEKITLPDYSKRQKKVEYKEKHVDL